MHCAQKQMKYVVNEHFNDRLVIFRDFKDSIFNLIFIMQQKRSALGSVQVPVMILVILISSFPVLGCMDPGSVL